MDFDSSFCDLLNINRRDPECAIFAELYDIIDKKRLRRMIENCIDRPKDETIAERYISLGDKSIKQNNWMQALYYFNGAVIYAPKEHEIFGIALDFRSKTFYYLEKYEESLKDIEILPTTKFRKCHYYSFYIRKSSCLYRLTQYKEAWKACEEAKLAFECTNEKFLLESIADTKKKLKNLEKNLRQVLELNTPETTITEATYELPPLLKGENDQYLNSSSALQITDNNRDGRHVVAKEVIEKGAILFVEEPYCISKTALINHLTFFCNHCLKPAIAFIPCNGCIEIFYCSVKCKEMHFNLRHRWECAGYRKDLFTPEMSLALAMLFRASFSNFKTETEGNVFGDKTDNYAYILTLPTNKKNMDEVQFKEFVKTSCLLVTYLQHFTNYFYWLRNLNPTRWRSTNFMYRTIGGFLFKHLLLIARNAEKIGDYFPGFNKNVFQGLSYHEKTLALYVSTRLVDHSCMPNAVVRYQGLTKIMTAVRNIEPGEKITVSYYSKKFILKNFELPLTHEIRQIFLEHYSIVCDCFYCSDDSFERRMLQWKCQFCFKSAITMNNGTHAKCLSCNSEFDLNIHKILEKSVQTKYMNMGKRFLNIWDLNVIEFKMNNIYHSSNLNFKFVYDQYLHIYENAGDYTKCIEYLGKIASLRLIWFGDRDEIFASIMVSYTIAHLKYFVCMKNIDVYHSNVEKKIKKDIKVILEDTVNLLKFHMSEETILLFQKISFKIINSINYIDPGKINSVVHFYSLKMPAFFSLSKEEDLI